MLFSDVVEIKNLSYEEKQKIQTILAQYLREERREIVYKNYQQSQVEEQNGKSKFSSNINELKKLLEE